MNKRYIVPVIVVLTAWLLWFFVFRSPSYDFANFPPKAEGPWVAFGDSLTAGFGASQGRDYPTVLGQRLGRKIFNFGRSGDTTADGLARLNSIIELQPSVVLLCLGGNDGLQKIPTEKMIANLGVIIERLHQRGTFVVLIGVRSASLLDKNEKSFRQLARDKRVFYVPNIFKGIFMKPIYMSDALHPNDAGYALIAERLEEELQPLLPVLTTTGSNE